MQQGSDISLTAPSTRIVAIFWWLFILILVSSYTANLAAFLTVDRKVIPLTSADDLVTQTKIKYGLLKDSSTMAFFKMSKIPTYEKMWEFMQTAQPPVFVKSQEEAIQRVLQEEYAYLEGSSVIEYYIGRNCGLVQVGGYFYSEGFGFALQKNSLYRDNISNAILMLQDASTLVELKHKWWKQDGGSQCEDGSDVSNDNSTLGLANVAGAFVILLIGLGLGLLVSISQLVYKARQIVPQNSHHIAMSVPAAIDAMEEGNSTQAEQVQNSQNQRSKMDGIYHS